MNDPTIKKLFDDNYVVVKLDVQETGEKKETLENPDGVKVMADLGGAHAGLPFYAILDAKGKKLGDANLMPNNMNIGYPAKPDEIAAFEKLIQDTAPHLTSAQRGALDSYLKEHTPKQ